MLKTAVFNKHGFGNHTPETARLCQPDQSDDRMNYEDDELAHSGNGIKSSKRSIELIFVIRHGHVGIRLRQCGELF
jgi:hypothetical protein